MTVSLQGNSPAALTAGILLLSRARSFGQRLQVEVVGPADEVTPVEGPAIVHSAVLASCGIGRRLGSGALVIVPGRPADPLAASLVDGGDGPWFEIDRSGAGGQEATQAFVRMCRHPALEVRDVARRLRRALAALGCAAEPAVLDLLFGAPVPPLVRVALSLRAGRALSGADHATLNRFLAQDWSALPDPLPDSLSSAELEAARVDGRFGALLSRVGISSHDPIEEWLEDAQAAAGLDPAFGELAARIVGVGSHVCALPPQSMLPPLEPIGCGRGGAGRNGATNEDSDANRTLSETFRFLGGASRTRPPTPSAWRRRSRRRSARTVALVLRVDQRAAAAADRLWRRVVDPMQ